MTGGGDGASGVPVACGAIGRFEPEAVARIAAHLSAELAEAHRDENSILMLDREPVRWHGGDGKARGLCWPERLPDRSAAATTWEEAAGAGACGLVLEGSRRAIHATNSGMGSVYWLRTDGAVYFATRIAALARAGLTGMSPDWQGWAEILGVTFPLQGRTPFAEIKRIERAGTVELDGAGSVETHRGSLDWGAGELVSREAAADRVIASLRADVADLEPEGPIPCLLTGGFDSRLIVAALAERDMVAATFTGDSDFGDDAEQRHAAAVARHLGVPHDHVPGSERPFADELADAAERVEYQSLLHLPMHRIVRAVPAGKTYSDGMGGPLLKGRYLREDMLTAPDPIGAVVDSWLPERLPMVYDPAAWSAIHARTRAAFLEDAERFRGHPMQTVLAANVRLGRCIGTAPMNIVGDRNMLFMPLAADEVAAAGLSAPVEDRRDRTFYRYVLDRISPGLGQLPSTNDGVDRELLRRPRLRSAEARDAHRDLLMRSPLRPWFTPTFTRWVERGRIGRIDKLRRRITRVQAICMFGLWCERYRDVIGEPDPGELFR